MADVSRESFVNTKNYRQVQFQQDRPVMDYELNEMQEIQRYIGGQMLRGSIGNMPYGAGFKVVGTYPASEVVWVRYGMFYNYTNVVEMFSSRQVTGLNLTGSETQVYDIYYVWSEKEVNSFEDPSIYDSTVNIETAIRKAITGSIQAVLSGQRLFLSSSQEAIYLASITVPAGAGVVQRSQISDLRFEYNQNYTKDGLFLTTTSGTPATGVLNQGSVYVTNRYAFITDKTLTFSSDSFNYVWINEAGEVQVSYSKPAPPCVVLWRVKVASDGTVEEVSDLRNYYPPMLGYLRALFEDSVTPRRQLYAGDTTVSASTSVVPQTLKSLTMFHDPEVALDIRHVGIVVRCRSINTIGHVRVDIDGVSQYQENIPSDGLYRTYKFRIPVSWNTPGTHEVEIVTWNDAPTGGGDAGQTVLKMFEGYVGETSGARRTLLFGEEGEDTVVTTTPSVVKEVSVYSDPSVGISVSRINYVAEVKATGGVGTGQIVIDGVSYVTFDVPEDDDYGIVKGSLKVAWPVQSLHTVQLRLSAPSEGSVYNRMFELYADQEVGVLSPSELMLSSGSVYQPPPDPPDM